MSIVLGLLLITLVLGGSQDVTAFTSTNPCIHTTQMAAMPLDIKSLNKSLAQPSQHDLLFDEFVTFLLSQQKEIISEIEESIEKTSTAKFGSDAWGVFDDSAETISRSGGITRVLQGGSAIEKGACSLTLIRDGSLTAERAATIRGRQSNGSVDINEGDSYSAVALSMVLHSRNPFVPTFRSDVRVFLVTDKIAGSSSAWFGGGADLTPYYLFPEDIQFFHHSCKEVCLNSKLSEPYTYESMKVACDDYFYLPARQEHRGTGGIFFDDMLMSVESLEFTKEVTKTWMPSWLPIVAKRNDNLYTERQKQWQKLRRGRYLEFNLLYDRGVKFGLQTANPRVEGVMVSAPPEISYEYNHRVERGSAEAALVDVLRSPQSWV